MTPSAWPVEKRGCEYKLNASDYCYKLEMKKFYKN